LLFNLINNLKTESLVVKETQQRRQSIVRVGRTTQRQSTPLRLGQIESSQVEMINEQTLLLRQQQQQQQQQFLQQQQLIQQQQQQLIEQQQLLQQQQQQQQQQQTVTRPAVTENQLILLKPLNRLELLEDTSGIFECKVQGQHLNIQWSKGNQPLPNNSNKYKMSYDQETGAIRLVIESIVKEDGGNYTCQISNQVGTIATTHSLVIIRKNYKNIKNYYIKLIYRLL